MQEKTLPKPKIRTSNIHSNEFGSVNYDIFGSPYQQSGSFLENDSLDFGYLGKPYNADTELYDYGFRDYSPEIARFSTVDPIRDGRNWFSYVVNDPVNYVDLWGLCGSDGNHWIDNGDGTFTALEGATLWGLYGADWQEKSGFEGDPTTLQVGDTVGKKVPRPAFQYSNSILERKEALLSPETGTTSANSSEISVAVGFGGKAALILGVGGEIGIIVDNSGDFYLYLSGSIGCGIQTPSGTKSNLSTLQYLKKSIGPTTQLSFDPIQVGTVTSFTADICLGVTATYDLNNQKSSGLPNSWGFGSVGGGVWKTKTVIRPL